MAEDSVRDIPEEAVARVGSVRRIENAEENIRPHYYVRLAEPAEEPWHIAWSDGQQQLSGWQSDEDMADAIDVGYVPVAECGRPASADVVGDIPEEMVEKAARAFAVSDGYDWSDVSGLWQQRYRVLARAALSAALAGRTVIDLPEPIANGDYETDYSSVWIDSGNRIASAYGSLRPEVAESYGAALIAAAHAARRLAAESGGES